jgi:hypothetical protein
MANGRGGHVSIVPPQYTGLYGLGQAANEIVDFIERRRREGEEKARLDKAEERAEEAARRAEENHALQRWIALAQSDTDMSRHGDLAVAAGLYKDLEDFSKRIPTSDEALRVGLSRALRDPGALTAKINLDLWNDVRGRKALIESAEQEARIRDLQERGLEAVEEERGRKKVVRDQKYALYNSLPPGARKALGLPSEGEIKESDVLFAGERATLTSQRLNNLIRSYNLQTAPINLKLLQARAKELDSMQGLGYDTGIIEAVSDRTGYSKATVAAALSGDPRVNPKVAQKVNDDIVLLQRTLQQEAINKWISARSEPAIRLAERMQAMKDDPYMKDLFNTPEMQGAYGVVLADALNKLAETTPGITSLINVLPKEVGGSKWFWPFSWGDKPKVVPGAYDVNLEGLEAIIRTANAQDVPGSRGPTTGEVEPVMPEGVARRMALRALEEKGSPGAAMRVIDRLKNAGKIDDITYDVATTTLQGMVRELPEEGDVPLSVEDQEALKALDAKIEDMESRRTDIFISASPSTPLSREKLDEMSNLEENINVLKKQRDKIIFRARLRSMQ